ncbi:MAG: NADPH-dependent 7-cyano-7-deazaguanine reductase QueF [Deltaproteobacteria bacterium]|jgi:7-cyano-7-deazaguanine reductase|nr:NADPH-dependent 7-cyano-7-deazaguanine reductase QueF [Deltaproteobacteria bacterium]
MDDFDRQWPLGKSTTYVSEYDPDLLCPVPRQLKRIEIGLTDALPFTGFDIWNAYELSWLDPDGKPIVAMGEFQFPCNSPNLVESKSLKLYLNSLNLTRFNDLDSVQGLIRKDLSDVAETEVAVRLFLPGDFSALTVGQLPGRCIDSTPVINPVYELDPTLLSDAADPSQIVAEDLYSHLLKSNCLVTSQPDWASVLIRYHGPKISDEALLRYLISFRQHNEFHEQCVERIYCDVQKFCRPEQLTVYARYTRRGGLDINPFRSNFEEQVANVRLARQ